MFKVGDEVWVRGKIAEVDTEDTCDRPYLVKTSFGTYTWVPGKGSEVTDKTYEQGLADVWELAKKITLTKDKGGISTEELIEVFEGEYGLSNILELFTVEQALAKIEAYEKEKEIKVGDEVVCDGNEEKTVFIVTCICGSFISGFDKGGKTHSYIFPNRFIQKTGKHIDIESLLKQIGE